MSRQPRFASPILRSVLGCVLGLSPALTGCGDTAKKPEADPKAATPAQPATPPATPQAANPEAALDLDPEPAHIDLSGPKPPETDAVFFAVDGALIPLACFDHAKGKLRGGPACGKMVAAGSEVYLKSETGAVLDVTGPNKNALCELARKPTSISAKGVDAGAQHDWGMWPRPAASLVQTVPVRTTTPKGSRLSDAEKTAVSAALKKFKSSINGDLRPKQRAEVDIDGNGKKELFISVSVAHRDDPDRFQFSGILMARDGDTSKLEVVEHSKRGTQETLHLRGILDLDGDGHFELWVNLAFDGGAGDRIVTFANGKAKALSRWSCGV